MNKLQKELSPYLLQHKDNPVHWEAWGEEALTRAIVEDKPILVSIGYAACHWCHVMEHESFENAAVAEIMNKYFINIKVDREERPDVDLVYMDALHHMGLQGGWPLNVFLLPNQKPFYGGTYFNKTNWIQVLESIQNAYVNHRDQLIASADGFASSIQDTGKTTFICDLTELPPIIPQVVRKMESGLDPIFGGVNKAPKFPLPALGLFIENLPYAFHSIKKAHELQLHKMAQGGIYDQLRGGFSRYSVDSEWFCPHFEKMLYDNAQLIQTYSLAYKRTQNSIFKEVVYATISFLIDELQASNGLFYAAIDADSEGVEGKFYTWTYAELANLLPQVEFDKFYKTFHISQRGNWENGLNILFKDNQIENSNFKIEFDKLVAVQNKRIRPQTDTKHILSWNALLSLSLFSAADSFNDPSLHEKAIKLVDTLHNLFYMPELNAYSHVQAYRGKPIIAFLDDCALMGQAFIQAYIKTANPIYLDRSKKLADYVSANHLSTHTDDQLLSYTSSMAENLIAQKFEMTDSVMPSSNSLACDWFFWLGVCTNLGKYTIKAKSMLGAVIEQAQDNPIYFANWLRIHSFWIENPTPIIKYNMELVKHNELLENYLFIPTLSLTEKSLFLICIGDYCLPPCETKDDLMNRLQEII